MSTKDKIGWFLIAFGVYSFFQGGSVLPIPVAPAPIDAPGLHVLIIEESGDRNQLPKDKLSVIQTTLIKQHIAEKGGQYKLYDSSETPEAEPWKSAMARPRTELPWLLVSNGSKGGYEGPVPAGGIEGTLKLIGGYE